MADDSVGVEADHSLGPDFEGGRAPAGASDPFANKRRVLVVVFLGVFMATLDGSIVSLALPFLATGFRVDPGAVAPVVSAYLVAVASSVLLFGALGDRLGRRRLYLSGFALFTVGSALCATAWSLEALVVFRVVQGVGGAMTFSIGPAILTQSFPRNERGAALGWIATAVAGGQTAGPVLGGLLLGAFGWPSIFLINLPVGAAAYIAAGRVLARDTAEARIRRADGTLPPFDLKAAVLLPSALLMLLVALALGPRLGLASLATLGCAAAFAAALLALRAVERAAEAPLVDLTVLRNPEFVAANVSAALSFFTIGAVAFVLPFYLKHIRGLEAYHMGLIMLPSPLAIALIGPLSGMLSDRIGSRIPCAAGLALAALSVATLSMLGGASNDFDVLWRLGLFGAGMALFQSPNNSSAMGSVGPRLLGLASGMLATMRSLGLALGVSFAALLLGLFYAAQTGGVPLPPGDVAPDEAAFVAAQRLLFLIVAALCAVGIAANFVRPNRAAAKRAPAPTPALDLEHRMPR